MLLTVLIPSLPERMANLSELVGVLQAQADPLLENIASSRGRENKKGHGSHHVLLFCNLNNLLIDCDGIDIITQSSFTCFSSEQIEELSESVRLGCPVIRKFR